MKRLLLIALLCGFCLNKSYGAPTLSNVRFTYGELGPERKTTTFLPGDLLFLAYDINNISVNDEGKISYSMAMEVYDNAGKAIFKKDPLEKEDYLPLGGTTLPARAFISIGFDLQAGTYKCKVIVTDRTTKQTVTCEKEFVVSKPDFGLVHVMFSADGEAKFPLSNTGIVGQSIFLHFAVVGFERDAKKDAVESELNIEIVDSTGKSVVKKPFPTEKIGRQIQKTDKGYPLNVQLPLTRQGEYKITIIAKDLVSKKTSKIVIPLIVTGQPKAIIN